MTLSTPSLSSGHRSLGVSARGKEGEKSTRVESEEGREGSLLWRLGRWVHPRRGRASSDDQKEISRRKGNQRRHSQTIQAGVRRKVLVTESGPKRRREERDKMIGRQRGKQ